MLKRLNKICKVLLLALTFVLGSTGFALAAENEIHISTESMEIRTEGKTGLRTISAIDKAYLEQLKAEGKEVTYGTVAVPASALEAAGGELQIGGSYALKGKAYKALEIPAEKNWKTTEEKVYYTGVLTGISGAGFNTRYAVRSYMKVDGQVSYGNTLVQSAYVTAQEMLKSSEVSTDQKKWLAKNVLDACDTAKKVTQDTLKITGAQVQGGSYTVNATDKVRNYNKVIVDSSVQGGEIVLNQLRIKSLEVAADADCTVTANDTVFDQIGKSAAGAGRAAGNFTLNLGAGSSVAKLVAGSNMTVNGALKIAEVEVAEVVQGFTLNVPAEELLVSEAAGGSAITINGTVENAVLNGDNSTIGGSGKLDKVQDNGNNQVEVGVGEEILTNSIVSVEVRGMSRMIVTLEKATTQPLAVEDMRIICHGGKEMTLLSAKTEDNRVYEVSTSVFAKDDTYTFSMEIAPGKIISKYFSYKVDCPTVSDATVLRSEATRAEFDLFDVDEGGYVYVYLPGHTQVSRAAEEIPSVDTVKKGYRKEMKTGFNKVLISGLEEGISYSLYYVMEAHDGRTSDVLGPITVSGNVQEDPNISSEYQIVSVGEKPKNTITVELNKAPAEELTLDNFSFICPTGSPITTDKAQLFVSEDRKVYTIVIPENYGHKDNQYIAKVTFSDGTVAKKSFVVEYNPPRITEQKVERISETSFRYSFVSDESGTLYYGTYNFNGSYNWENNTPTGDQLVGGEIASSQIQMHSGYNQVEISYNGTDKDYFALPVDVYGNYAGYTEHDKIPAYVPQVPEQPKLAIESIFYNKEESDYGTCLDVTFTTAIDGFPDQRLIKFEVIQGTSPGKLLLETSFLDESHTKLRMRTLNGEFSPGTYKVIMYVSKDGQLQKVEKEFIID
ncbi:hypothetical protein [Faecalimonas umbilicata]|uniref:hypothetical protein n=1 Tax=Faecalimonas umbilicata TaxID=1912855 RepID=UPI000E4101EA|nr:hypothetical protein [Faecalimonas umbilicata]RGC78975.1 hypothetical protein DW669_02815 [Lachnospiraceae bacterium AM25-17]RJU67881.1 hypothetical protein DW709_05275 [Coprococcus sp. AM27-12LB]